MFFITISRQTGSLGHEIAQHLAERLGLEVITHDLVLNKWLPEVANAHELSMLAESPRFYLNPTRDGENFADYIKKRLQEIVEKQSVIILGLGAQVIFANHPDALHVRIIASDPVRLDRVLKSHRLEKQDAGRFLDLSDRKHRRFINTIYEKDWSDPVLYDLTLNTDNLGITEASAVLTCLAEVKKAAAARPDVSETSDLKQPVSFKHQSEEEFAKILDMYNINWEYEPRTFPIEWDAEGNITKAFSPDFYLPNFDTYIEITTMDQKYVSEKKKKVRRLKELYPGTNINIVFKNDFYSLLKRFGLNKGADK
ncbi:MAG TPA: cytidylate kinase family protein [Desulfobacteria bacterium]|nr:cytidylate kinase family protein [Desulfobacteria bacterium]